MNSYLKKALFSLFIASVLFSAIVILTGAEQTLQAIRPDFFFLASVFFLASIMVWVVSWAYLIKRTEEISYLKLVIVGFSAVFGALTPLQVGAEALRSIKLKKHFNVTYTDSVSAAMVVNPRTERGIRVNAGFAFRARSPARRRRKAIKGSSSSQKRGILNNPR